MAIRTRPICVGAAIALAAASAHVPAADAAPPRVATFRCDATPPPGEPLIWATPLAKVEQPLLAKGVVLEKGGERYVLCAFDWCEICNDTDLEFRTRLAEAVGTDPTRAIVHTVHQHAAPYADSGAHRLLDKAPGKPLRLSDAYLAELGKRLAEAAGDAARRLEPFDRVGVGKARVDRVASTRRLRSPDGKIIVRYSGGGKDPALAAAPEGTVDPVLRTITLASGSRPLVRLHYYATHPQTFCCDGVASSDFVGTAREAVEQREKVFQVSFTGCGGDVTVGKYNDGTARARSELAVRLQAGLEAAIAATEYGPAAPVEWRRVPLVLPLRTDRGYTADDWKARLADPAENIGSRVYRSAIPLAFAERLGRPLETSALALGPATVLHLPGEPMLDYQFFAQGLRPDRFVAVAGYCDCGPGYVCTERAFTEGGYEPTDSNVAPSSEALVQKAIRDLLGEDRTDKP